MLGHAALDLLSLLWRKLKVVDTDRDTFPDVVGQLDPFLDGELHDLIAQSFVHDTENSLAGLGSQRA
jgi:hypothetical protein